MRLLLDTQVLLWWLADAPMGEEARRAINDPGNDVLVSAASTWEISLKQALGKLRVPDDLLDQLGTNAMTPLPISLEDALSAGSLPALHGDPFDRLLIAQALAGDLVVVTRDDRFAGYGVRTLAA
ncbi:MAG TPA: type II toxin-antitoxin system VapC family toxin [Acidimicrobiales bacterium]|nr:type II toxin-antitoxin system VapC family toxin [Acidimicrobiales bacterium]